MFEFIFEFTFNTSGFQRRVKFIPRSREGRIGETESQPLLIRVMKKSSRFRKG